MRSIIFNSKRRNLAISIIYFVCAIYILCGNIFKYTIAYDLVFCLLCFLHMINTHLLLIELDIETEKKNRSFRKYHELQRKYGEYHDEFEEYMEKKQDETTD